ncbi:hypothetical protein DKT68_06070 [Micromonospora acroterricola]|uniref:Right handed beta helix region n=1 Tax=Micromonospora acroterricola TaxID=2202421 RepID=A0A317DEZ7_9ACTN|nr:hypothetical protein [Micromonospora acroterricola]PWR11315.1 hypothetical protein DKT68_06070 [Micromonospora acroterricola]
MPRRTVAKLATVTAVVASSVLAVAPSAHADLVTYCIGTGGAVTVPNDLYVPAGESCALTGTTITGNVSVAAGGNLVVTGGTVSGEVRVAADGYLDATDTTIGGQVVLAAGGYGTFLKDARTGNVTVRPKGAATIDSFLFVEGSTIVGTVNAGAGEVRLDRGTQVERNLSTTGTYYTDVHDSFVDGTLSVLNSATGSVVCGSAVRGQATFAGNLGAVQLGPNGTLDSCASGGYWGRDVSITNTTGGVTVDDNIIDGKLALTSNNPVAQVAGNNRIRGGVTGDQAGAGTSRMARAAAVADREDAGEQRAEARRTSAVQEAVAAGAAGL